MKTHYLKCPLFIAVLLLCCKVATAQSQWSTVGHPAISDGNAYVNTVNLDKYGTPYVAYIDLSNNRRVFVKKYDGIEWLPIGNFPTVPINDISTIVDSNGTPCVAYIENANLNRIKVVQYDGNNWVQIGADIISGGPCRFVTLKKARNGTMYLTYTDDATKEKLTVMKYDGSNWVVVGIPAFTDGFSRYLSLAIDNVGTPYVAFADGNANGSSEGKITVVKFDGSNWLYVGSRRFSDGNISITISLQIDNNGTPYVAYYESVSGSTSKLVVEKYDGIDWATVGTTVNIGFAYWPSLSIDCNNTLYLAYTQGRGHVVKYNGNSWESVGNTDIAIKGMYGLSMAIDCSGVYYISYTDGQGGKARVMRHGVSGWTDVGGESTINEDSRHITLKFDSNDLLYLAYNEASYSQLMEVKKYNGSAWVQVGNVDSLPKGGVRASSLAIDNNDNPYIAYIANGMMGIKKFDGNNWLALNSNGLNTFYANDIFIAVDGNDTPYVAFTQDGNGSKISVVKYNGLSWTLVGSASFSAGAAIFPCFAIDRNNVPYVAYRDASNGNKATVMKYDGTAWVPVGNVGFSSGFANNFSLAFDNGNIPYLSYANNNAHLYGGMATVRKYDGVNWVAVGDTAFSSDKVQGISLAFNKNNTPYVSYMDWANREYATVMKYNGAKWFPVGANGFSNGGSTSTYTSLALSANGTLHVAYKYRGINGDKVSVMKYGCPEQPQLAICAVYTDTISGNNVIIWNGNNIPRVDSYKVYREDNGTYTYLGSIGNGVNKFVDATANPATQSYRYKLTLTDFCEQEADIDSVGLHKTIRLVFDSVAANIAHISWNSYEGTFNPVYIVKRSNNGGAFISIDSFNVIGGDTTFADINPPLGSNQYRIDMTHGNSCSVGFITSNTVMSLHTTISEKAYSKNITVIPNPADKEVKVSMDEAIVKIEVFSLSGKKIITEKGNNEKESVIDISVLSSGMYFIRVNDVHNALFIKK